MEFYRWLGNGGDLLWNIHRLGIGAHFQEKISIERLTEMG